MSSFFNWLRCTICSIYESYSSFATSVVGESFFGFSEFLTGLALLMIVWSTTDYKYRFRLYISRLSKKALFIMTVIVGLVTLACDFVASIGVITHLTQFVVQLICGLLLFGFVMYWIKTVFLSPPVFNKSNCKKFATEFAFVCENGSDEELNILVQETIFSLQNIVRFAHEYDCKNNEFSEVEKCVYKIFSRMGTERFCHSAVRGCFGRVLFGCMIAEKKFNVGLETFAENYITELLKWDGSFIFRESDFRNGYLWVRQPLITEIFGSKELVVGLNELIRPDYSVTKDWNHKQVRAYVAILTKAFDTCYGGLNSDTLISEAYENLEKTAGRVCWDEKTSRESLNLFSETMNFYEKVIRDILSNKKLFGSCKTYSDDYKTKDFLDYFVDSVLEILYFAGSFRGEEKSRRSIQLMDCLDRIFSNSNPQNDCVIFYEKLKEAVLLQVKKNSGLVGFNILMLFLVNRGLKKNSMYGNKYLIEIHDMLVDYAEEHFLEMYEKIHTYKSFKLPEKMTVDTEKKVLVLKGRTIFKDYVQVLQLK
ncbi:hypothetical protein [uncultured Fibrobacter sp.]|uniref:hypothetical protein n=1 Tax=uncultured Fibrobacter sp. TaxID=261512 RepID=UPI0025EAF432|nr:hypothetical protein [uncultured Fibrobacter sp.]